MSAADQRLQDALAAEHAAIYGYQVLGAHLTGHERDRAQSAEYAHRHRRDALTVRLADQHATPTPAAPAYTLPKRVTNRARALALALRLEERTAAVWSAGLPELTDDDRRHAVDALADCAVRATGWRQTARRHPYTVAFPGSS